MARTECGFADAPHLLARFGPTLLAHIGFDASYNSAGTDPPELPEIAFPALVDTGAQENCIDAALALELALPVVDRTTIAGVDGAIEVNRHLAQVYIPELDWTVYGTFMGVHLAAGGSPHTALIGRTFLEDFTLIYDGRTGRVTLENEAPEGSAGRALP